MEFVAVLFAMAGLVWLVPLLRIINLPVFAFIVLITGTFFGPPFFAVESVLQISADRLLWLVLLALYVINWRLGKTPAIGFSRCDFALFAFLLFLAVSSQVGPAPPKENPLARWIFYVLMPMGLYWSIRCSSLTRRDLDLIINGIVGLGVYLGITGLFEAKGLHGLVFPRYVVDPAIWEFFGRARGPMLNPAGNGVVLGTSLAAAACRWVQADRQGKLLYGVAILCILAGIYATLTRGVWVGGILALGVVVLNYSPRWLRIWGLAVVVVLFAAMSLGLKDQMLAMKRDKHLPAEDAAKSIKLRPLLAIVALEMFKDAPLTGHGFGHYFQHADRYYEVRSYDLPVEMARGYMQHNVLLSILVDTGLIGLSCFVGALLFWTSYGLRFARDHSLDPAVQSWGLISLGMLVTYLFNGMFQDMLVMPMVQMHLFFIMGVLASLVSQRGMLFESARAGTRFGPPSASIAAVLPQGRVANASQEVAAKLSIRGNHPG